MYSALFHGIKTRFSLDLGLRGFMGLKPVVGYIFSFFFIFVENRVRLDSNERFLNLSIGMPLGVFLLVLV